MNAARFALALLLLGCPSALRAQDAPSPIVMAKEFSADMVITPRDGDVIEQTIYSENGMVRSELTAHDMPMIVILRPDRQKMYTVMEMQKMIMEMPLDPAKTKQYADLASGLQGKYENLGPDIADGVACIKYRYTADDGKVYTLWANAATKVPVRMEAQDGSFTMDLKNFKPGPQPAALFEIPAGYQVMTMPAMPNMPGMPSGSGTLPGSGMPQTTPGN
jgi:hypothetical protein